MPNQSADYFDDKYEASYEQYSQVLDKYTGRGEEKKFWNKICDMEEVSMEEAQLKEKLERDIDRTMDKYLKERHEELRQINLKKLKAYYEKR